MQKALLDGVIALLYGFAAWIAWWFVVMLGFGAVGSEAVAVYLIGVPIAAGFGLVLGKQRGPDASIAAICVGWALSTLITPAMPSLLNPAPAADKPGAVLILASVLGIGILGAISGLRFSGDRNRRRLIPLAVATIAVTVSLAAVTIIWKW